MDFGDILDSWDSISKTQQNKSTKQANVKKMPKLAPDKVLQAENKKQETIVVPKKEKSSKQSMEAWLNRYGVVDKDAISEKRETQKAFLNVTEVKHMVCEAKIDLHGLTKDEAWIKLDAFISECCKRDLKKVLIVHGKGNHSDKDPVLNAMVRTFIEKDYRLGMSGHPDACDGGKGSTWVLIKKTDIDL